MNKVNTQAMSKNLLSYTFTSLNPFLEDEIWSSRKGFKDVKALRAFCNLEEKVKNSRVFFLL